MCIILKSFFKLNCKKEFCFCSLLQETETLFGIMVFWVASKNCIVKNEYIYIYIYTALQIDTPLLVTMNTMNRKINHQSNLIFGGHNKTKKKQKKTSLRIFSMSISNSVLVQMLSLHKCICSISCLVKKCMNFDRACKFFNKKTLKKATCLQK